MWTWAATQTWQSGANILRDLLQTGEMSEIPTCCSAQVGKRTRKTNVIDGWNTYPAGGHTLHSNNHVPAHPAHPTTLGSQEYWADGHAAVMPHFRHLLWPLDLIKK